MTELVGPVSDGPRFDAVAAEAIIRPDTPEVPSLEPVVQGVVLDRIEDRTRPVPRPVLPTWLKSRDTFVSSLSWVARYSSHEVARHGIRLPLYWLRLASRSPVGVGRIVKRLYLWTVDAQGGHVRAAMNPKGADAADFVKLTQQRRELVRGRLLVTALVLSGTACVAYALVTSVTALALLGVTVGILAMLGFVGRSPDRPVITRAPDSGAVPRLTADLILVALASLGIAELNKSLKPGTETGVRFPSPIMRDGPGFRAEIDLPPGVTAGDIIERRDRLASGLRRPLSCVWPSGDHDTHAGRLILYVADKSMSKAKPVVWPLAKTGKVDLFAPFPIGVDPQGRPISVTLMFALMILGAIPRMGKTYLLRLLALAASLDPTAELHLYDLKGGADWLPLENVAHRFRIGDDPEDLDYLKADLRSLQTDMRRRYKTLRSLPRDVCPEAKVTRALADRRDLGLWPVVLVIDECQFCFDDDPEIVAMVTDLGKRGPAAGIMVLLATQRVDAKSIPTPISSNAVLRFCMKVTGQTENDMVLGTSMYKAGVRATTFARTDYGVGYLAGESNEPVIVRTAYVDGPAAETIAARARAARLAAGLLTGHATGLEPEPEGSQDSILEHLAAIWPLGQEKVWWDDLAELLGAAFPGLYSEWTGEQVTVACRPHGLKGGQIKRTVDGRQVNRRGLSREHLNGALGDRVVEPFNPQDWLAYDPDAAATSQPDPRYR